jgi:hypothetical protein
MSNPQHIARSLAEPGRHFGVKNEVHLDLGFIQKTPGAACAELDSIPEYPVLIRAVSKFQAEGGGVLQKSYLRSGVPLTK